MRDHKTYVLTTIKDIFDAVPSDRWHVLFSELEVLMDEAAFVRGVAGIAVADPGAGALFPETITWIDDGKGEVSVEVTVDDQGESTVATITSYMKSYSNVRGRE